MNRTTLNKATSPDASPTPGYLFDEIAKVTHDPVANDKLVEYLLKRLDSPSADVKAKVLNIIKHVCRKGNPSFRRSWQRESPAIKAHLQYHTAPDPLRGEEPSRRVRENAKEALEAVFDASKDERKADPNLAGRISGFGTTAIPADSGRDMQSLPTTSPVADSRTSSSYSSVSSQSRYPSGSRFEGVGNPEFPDPRNQPKTFLERVADAVREKVDKSVQERNNIVGVGGVKPPWMNQGATNDLPAGYTFASNRGNYSGGGYSSTSGTYDPTAVQRTQAAAADPVWTDPRSPRPISTTVSGMPMAQPNGSIASARPRTSEPSDGTYERKFVEELCAPGGVRPVPPKDKLDTFVKACKTLDPNWVITLLDDKLGEEDWKVQHKALCVLEAILATSGLDAYANRLDANPNSLEVLYNSKNATVRERAQKVWQLLYEDEDGQLQQQSQSSTQQQQNKQDDFNLLELNTSAQTALGSSIMDMNTSTNSTNNVMPSMFGNLTVKSGAANLSEPAPSPSSSGFSFLSPSQQAAQSPSMFGSLSPQVPQAAAFSQPSSGGYSSQPTAGNSMNLLDMPMPSTTSSLSFGLPSGSTKNNNADVDLLSLNFGSLQPTQTKPSGSFPISSMQTGKPAGGSNVTKKPDSFDFVQQALQGSKKA